MRRTPIIACATALIAAGLLSGLNDSATAARKPGELSASVSLQPNATHDACVLSITWFAAEPTSVAAYSVKSDAAPITAKSTSSLQAKMTNETTASWVIADNAGFYVDITAKYVDGRWSKPMSIGFPSWDCLG